MGGRGALQAPELASNCSCLPAEAAEAPLLGDSFRTQVLWTHARKYRLLKVVSQLPSPSQETPVLQPHLARLLRASTRANSFALRAKPPAAPVCVCPRHPLFILLMRDSGRVT